MMKVFAAFLGFLLLPGVVAQPPSNDECVNATIILPGQGTTTNFTTAPIEIKNATDNFEDPVTDCSDTSSDDERGYDGRKTVWFSWKPLKSGNYDFTTERSTLANVTNTDFFFPSGVSTIIGVFKGASCNVIQELACTRPFSTLRNVDLVAGQQYYIKVGIFAARNGGTLLLTVKPAPPSPFNTVCINATTVDPNSQALTTGDITNALVDEASLPCADQFFGFYKGLWYKFTNRFDSPLSLVISTCYEGTDFDSLISVFEGNECGSLSCIGTVDDIGSEECQLKAEYGFLASPQTTYYVLVQGYEEAEGKFKLGFNASSNYFALIDSEKDRLIEPLGDYVYYSNVNSKLNIQAVFPDVSAIGSVLVKFDDPEREFCEELPPYSVFYNNDEDYLDAVIPIGSHTVSATSYAADGCAGAAGSTISRTFDVYGCYIDYSVYDVANDCPRESIYGFGDYVYPIDAVPCEMSIQVYTYCGFEVNTVQIELRNTVTNTIVATKTETTNPYFLFGNEGSDVTAGSIAPGNYSITSTVDGIKHEVVPFTIENNCVP